MQRPLIVLIGFAALALIIGLLVRELRQTSYNLGKAEAELSFLAREKAAIEAWADRRNQLDDQALEWTKQLDAFKNETDMASPALGAAADLVWNGENSPLPHRKPVHTPSKRSGND